VKVSTNTHTRTEELWEAVFSLRSVPELYNNDQLSVSPSRVRVKSLEESRQKERESLQAESQFRVAETEGGDSSGTQRKGNVHRWKPLPSSAVKTVTDNTSLCVILISKIWSQFVCSSVQ
jgi:hypothetical protein